MTVLFGDIIAEPDFDSVHLIFVTINSLLYQSTRRQAYIDMTKVKPDSVNILRGAP